MAFQKNTNNFIGFVIFAVIALLIFLLDNKSTKQAPTTTVGSVPIQDRGIPTGLIPSGPWPPVDSVESAGSFFSAPQATNYYVVFDASGSMNKDVGNEVKISAAKRALYAFGSNIPQDANLGMLTFSPVKELVPLAPNNRAEFEQAVSSITARGNTPLIRAMTLGYDALTKQAQKQSGYGRYVLLVVTDGRSSDGNPRQLAVDIVKNSAIEVQVIGFGLADHALNVEGFTDYYVANSVDALIDAFGRVVASESESFVDPVDFSN